MDNTVSAGDAKRRFLELLSTVQKGGTVVVTSHGKAVAKIIPVPFEDRAAEAGRSALFARLKRQPLVGSGRWTRDELYE